MGHEGWGSFIFLWGIPLWEETGRQVGEANGKIGVLMSLDNEGVVWLCSGRKRRWWPHRVKWPGCSYTESCSTQASSCILEDSRRGMACVLRFKRGRAPSWSHFVPSMANPHNVYPMRAQKKKQKNKQASWMRSEGPSALGYQHQGIPPPLLSTPWEQKGGGGKFLKVQAFSWKQVF